MNKIPSTLAVCIGKTLTDRRVSKDHAGELLLIFGDHYVVLGGGFDDADNEPWIRETNLSYENFDRVALDQAGLFDREEYAQFLALKAKYGNI